MREPCLIYTNENCVGCNRCVRVCTSHGASISCVFNGKLCTVVDNDKCVSCSACFDACAHGARSFNDDTEAFFEDLESGIPISVITAPSFRASYPEEYKRIQGGLLELGVKRILPVSFGADICTWAYINHMMLFGNTGFLSTTCPVIVAYVERYIPQLIPKLMPVKSPMMCLAIYARKVLGLKERFAFLGPCIGKKLEMADRLNEGLVQYNLTYERFMTHVRKHNVYGEPVKGQIHPGMGVFYPAPGGLGDNIRWFLGDDCAIRQIEGKEHSYKWLHANAASLAAGNTGFALFDILNCDSGCVGGPGTEHRGHLVDKTLCSLMALRSRAKQDGTAWGRDLTPRERLARLNEQFKDLNLEDYYRTYDDFSEECALKMPSEAEINKIFMEMHKVDAKSRQVDCAFCGYDSCRSMAIHIYNGMGDKRNCIHYVKDESLRMERMSFRDQLTGVMNRNAYEHLLTEKEMMDSLTGLLLGDINGLKTVNDNEGHLAGDRLIIRSATTLSEIFGTRNVYRMGGDEFLVPITEPSHQVIREKLKAVRKLMRERGFSMSLGLALRKHGESLEAVYKEADFAMYTDKEAFYLRTGKKKRH